MRLYLVKNGIPFDLAFGASDEWVFASYVTFVEIEGYQEFDWEKETWHKRGQ